jgi:hypothetical protein
MNRENALKMAKAKLECIERASSGLENHCNHDCDDCSLCYEQGNVGEQKECLKILISILEQQHSKDGMEKHTDRQIYDGCIHLMQKMVDYFREYLEYLGYDLDKLDEDDRFAVGISNMEIVRWLFLFHTRNSGGCSTRDFCEKIGIDDSDVVTFEFERDEE